MHWTLAPAVSFAVQTKLLLSTVVGRLGSLDPQGGSLVQKSAKKSPMLGLPSPKAAPSTRGTITGKLPRGADGLAPTSPAPMALDATKVTLKKLAATSGTVAVVRTRSAVSVRTGAVHAAYTTTRRATLVLGVRPAHLRACYGSDTVQLAQSLLDAIGQAQELSTVTVASHATAARLVRKCVNALRFASSGE